MQSPRDSIPRHVSRASPNRCGGIPDSPDAFDILLPLKQRAEGTSSPRPKTSRIFPKLRQSGCEKYRSRQRKLYLIFFLHYRPFI